jgi:Major Facilitator Superfamily
MMATGAVELPIEVGATAAVDTTIAATVGGEKVSLIVDQSRDQSSAPLAQSQRQGIKPKPGIEVKEDVKPASNHDPEKQAQGGIIDNGASETTVGGAEVRPLLWILVVDKRLLTCLKIGWDGPEDQENPYNWSRSRKTTLMMLISVYRTTTSMAGSFLAPALQNIAVDLKIPSQQLTNIILSAYALAFAVGPLFLGPTSEVFGRTRVLHCANVFFLLFNIAAGFSTTASQMTAFRFLSGIGGSAPTAVSINAICTPTGADKK